MCIASYDDIIENTVSLFSCLLSCQIIFMLFHIILLFCIQYRTIPYSKSQEHFSPHIYIYLSERGTE